MLDSGHLVPCQKANYLQKLGLELSPPGREEDRAANRSPLQLLPQPYTMVTRSRSRRMPTTARV